jgi:RHS repeat-associated protein
LTSSGSVQGVQLYAPYGAVRYSSGSMPTSYGFTKQRLDGSGLNYFHARYYDSSVGLFTSADSVQGPNRYGYVGGNPETRTDPSGNCWILCAVVAAVVVGVATTVGNAVIQQVTTGSINWGQAAATGAEAGLTIGAVIALGPVGGALAGAAFGAITGAGEGYALGASAHHSGLDLLRDTVIGGISGAVGGAIGGSIGGGPVSTFFAGVGSNLAANVVGQLLTDPKHFSVGSAALAAFTGGVGAVFANTFGLGPIFGGIETAAIDFVEQNAWNQQQSNGTPPATPVPASPTPTPHPNPGGRWLY